MKKCQVYEQAKAEISEENRKAILSELEDGLSRIAARADVDDDEGEIRLDGLNERFCQASATLRLTDKNGKYILSGDVNGKARMLYWGVFGGGILLFLIFLLTFGWLWLVISIAIDVAVVVLLNNDCKKISSEIGEKFRDAVKEIN